MNIYDRVRELANERNITIAELERRAALTPQTVTNWRRSKPSGEALDKVASAFNTSVDYLLGRTDSRIFYKDSISVNIDDQTVSISYKDHELTDHQRSDLQVYIETMMQTKYW
ncbi:MAG: helix-turn-helix domain-containing protein [Leuconostoc lactis]|uniref:Helix-turn-helix domain-containing protein n=1 Tax=Leuconostoc lactis TaxID=1246 RepID=A0A6L7A6V0_LEULA|nr:helix-turn-helix transcriptional regulator [uncultured Leuconostoc sp.]MWN21356.1 helix-turn-helix domain-containing protein [Leuconostoc lactis]